MIFVALCPTIFKGHSTNAYATSRGTRCRQFLFSLSLNPPENEKVPVEVFANAINRVENKLGLQDQPRVIVFHEKEGRRHAHCVWSRINTDEMKAVHLPHFKRKLADISKELYLEHNWQMPKGFVDKNQKSPFNFTRDEWNKAQRSGKHPKDVKIKLQECWAISDSRKALEQALNDRGYVLARDDKRGYVAVDVYGEVYSLSRQLSAKKQDIHKRLGDTASLQSVDDSKKAISSRLAELFKKHQEELAARHKREVSPLIQRKNSLTQEHRDQRQELQINQEERWKAEELARSNRLRKGFQGLWDRLTGSYQRTRRKNEAEIIACLERDKLEKQQLIDSQLNTRRPLQSEFKQIREKQRHERLELYKDVKNSYESLGRQDSLKKLLDQEREAQKHTKNHQQKPSFDPEM
jgi:hypothetical protein